MNYPILKQIRINNIQAKNWDNDAIRKFLDGSILYILDKIKEMFENGVIKVYQDKLTKEYKKVLEDL